MSRAHSSPIHTLARSALAAAILSLAVTFACLVTAESRSGVVGTLMFPAGFATIIVTGLELYTVTAALVFTVALAGQARWQAAIRSTLLVYIANFGGALLLAGILWGALSSFGAANQALPPVAVRLAELAAIKIAYAELGLQGWGAAFLKGLLCNFLLCTGVVVAALTHSFVGKIVAAWIAAIMFFGLGLEHTVINMFLIPAGMLFGAPVSVREFLFWNLLPVSLGNFVGGILITWSYTRLHPPSDGVISPPPSAALPATLSPSAASLEPTR